MTNEQAEAINTDIARFTMSCLMGEKPAPLPDYTLLEMATAIDIVKQNNLGGSMTVNPRGVAALYTLLHYPACDINDIDPILTDGKVAIACFDISHITEKSQL